MSETRPGNYRANRRRRRPFGGRRTGTNKSSLELGEFSQKGRGMQAVSRMPRRPRFLSAKNKALPGTPLIKEILIGAMPSVVFQFLTDPTKIVLWMGIRAEIGPRCGGTYRLQLNRLEVILGEYLELVPDTRLVFTWRWEEAWRSVPARSTRVEFDLEPNGENTRARLSHGQLLVLSD